MFRQYNPSLGRWLSRDPIGERLGSSKNQNFNDRGVWTDSDFDEMGWHDCKIYAVAFYPESFEVAFDIDYIFKWELEENQYKFWVSPATLVFYNVRDFSMDSWNGGYQIDSIERTAIGKPKNYESIKRDTEWLWVINCQEGDIKLKCVAYSLDTSR